MAITGKALLALQPHFERANAKEASGSRRLREASAIATFRTQRHVWEDGPIPAGRGEETGDGGG